MKVRLWSAITKNCWHTLESPKQKSALNNASPKGKTQPTDCIKFSVIEHSQFSKWVFIINVLFSSWPISKKIAHKNLMIGKWHQSSIYHYQLLKFIMSNLKLQKPLVSQHSNIGQQLQSCATTHTTMWLYFVFTITSITYGKNPGASYT
jgi:hypothetical protein